MLPFLIVILVIIISVYAFFRLYIPFGGRTARSAKQSSPNFVDGKFTNKVPVSMGVKPRHIIPLLRKQLFPSPERKPARPLVPERFDPQARSNSSEPRITWFGHSAFLLQMHGKNILLDPMLGKFASPFQFIGPQRYSDSLPCSIDDLPHIDVVVISHDHYDHLDYPSIRQLARKTTMFFVPLGLAAHLRRWGVRDDQITELDWWDERDYEGLTLACTPSRHFSGRTLTDRYATLWCSWVIRDANTSIYFSGDSGYGPHFKQIGTQYGPFDLTLLECGQYNDAWRDVHMMPEQTAQAHTDLRGKRMIAMHWGAFTLALHDWTDPIKRVLAAGKKQHSLIMTPKIGQTVAFMSKNPPEKINWWEQYEQEQ